jgi:hypothetical protein
MSPHEILGIRPTASIDEAEAAYRARLRECHPDLHAHAGADAVAWAEQRTRALNRAIEAIRAGGADFRRHIDDAFGAAHGFTPGPGTDWFGNTIDPRPSVRCVFCGLAVEDANSYRTHLLLDHAFVERARRQGRRTTPSWLTWIPAPTFWSLVLLIAYGAVLFDSLGDSGLAVAGWWAGIAAFLAFLPFAYRAERYRRRF